MSGDEYRAVPASERTLLKYPCGLKAGDRLRLKSDLTIRDHDGRPTGERIAAGTIWTVLAGHPNEPSVVWLREPGGAEHTWDESVLEAFEPIELGAA